MQRLEELLEKFPIVAGINEDTKLKKALFSKIRAVFLLNAKLNKLNSYKSKCEEKEKQLFLHLDLIRGMSSDKEAISYLASKSLCDGIITTHKNLIEYSQNKGFYTIQRIFVLDSGTIKNGINSLKKIRPDAVEILPGLMAPFFIDQINYKMDIPFIAGGLIRNKEHVDELLNKGIMAVSTSEDKLWY